MIAVFKVVAVRGMVQGDSCRTHGDRCRSHGDIFRSHGDSSLGILIVIGAMAKAIRVIMVAFGVTVAVVRVLVIA